ncbi:hypothetical protein EVAR_9590_1 [Eumeta japonica]|uniref:Uncharacterized protein n=1 Tax=Eumeta variegata TaxID=151549 RepID=A0A4C1TM58_EUMVA|nr:hypothetical protein EVAR_9590_1 [Eumeta japonica]
MENAQIFQSQHLELQQWLQLRTCEPSISSVTIVVARPARGSFLVDVLPCSKLTHQRATVDYGRPFAPQVSCES